jgi:6-phosphogluconolactonase (cycloisomerase 2 family)
MRALGAALLVSVLALAVFALPSTHAATVSASTTGASAVFIQTNAVNGNQVAVYDRSSTGGLTWVANYSTGGNGTGSSLADQGSLAISSDRHWLLAVDAGSDQVSAFRVGSSGGSVTLNLTNVVSSGGILPVSVTVSGHWVYVLNDGSATSQGSIAGFWLTANGKLNPIAGSTQALSTTGSTGAAQISFNPAGTVLAVTEKSTNVIDTYTVNSRGVASGPITHTSQGSTPYGFAFGPSGQLIVSEAASDSLSSYAVSHSGGLKVRSSSIADLQTAPCWVAVTGGGLYAYTSNGHSNSISSYAIGSSGKITLLQSIAASTGSGPNDVAIALGAHLLYVYNAGAQDIEAFWIHSNGTLTWVQTTGGLPSGAEGLVAI